MMSETFIVDGGGVADLETAASGLVLELSDGGLGVAWVRVAGELDLATAPRLERMLRGAQLRARLVVLDVRELTFMDSSGAHAIVYASVRARRAGRRLVVLRGPSQVQRLLALSGATDAIETVDQSAGEPAVQVLLQLARADQAA